MLKRRPYRLVASIAVATATTLALGVAGTMPALRPDLAAAAGGCDALCSRVRAELAVFTGWLARNSAEGFIGEVGWPDDGRGDGAAWSALAESWFADADAARLWVTAWSTGEWWGTSYPLAAYEDRHAGAGVDSADSQAAVLERHPSAPGVLRGVNVAGAEFAAPAVDPTSSFSNANPGDHGVAYQYDGQATFDYLASRGVRLVRLPVRWERLQRSPSSPLDGAEVNRLRAAIARAGAAGLGVVVDIHNYGGYYLYDGSRGVRRAIGSPELPLAAFADLWSRLSAALDGLPALVGYGLMNEPVGLPSLDGQPPARTWERASQAAVDAIRARGDRHLVLVAGNEWSGVQRWTDQHPVAWVRDPASAVRYEGHHYWDRDNSGQYTRSYAEELADARARGYTDAAPPPAAASRSGYRLVASDGGIFAFGDAVFRGSTGAISLNRPIVGMAATPSGNGYWLVASDGGIFAFGDAVFRGSTGAISLNRPIVGMAASPSGNGYWLVASDGGIFAFGDAVFRGSTGAISLNRPIVGMAATPSGNGYWLVASDGGIFSFGDAVFRGSTGAISLNKPIVGMAATATGNGYWLAASDGGIFSFGDAMFHGSTGSLRLVRPVVGVAL